MCCSQLPVRAYADESSRQTSVEPQHTARRLCATRCMNPRGVRVGVRTGVEPGLTDVPARSRTRRTSEAVTSDTGSMARQTGSGCGGHPECLLLSPRPRMYVRFGVVTVVGRAEGTYCMASEGPSPVAGGPTWGNSPETPPAWVPRQPLRVTSAVRAQRASELWVNQPRWKPSGGFEWPFEAWWGARHSVRRVAAGSLGRRAASEAAEGERWFECRLGNARLRGPGEARLG